jgi:hypothetical protein
MIVALIGVAAVAFFGWLVARLFLPRPARVETIAVGYLLGWGLFTFILFLANLVGVPYQLLPAASILVGLSLIAALIGLSLGLSWTAPSLSWVRQLKKQIQHRTKLQKLALAALLILGLSPILPSLYWPVKDWDSIVLYDFRAQTFVQTGFMDDGIARGYFFGYPLLTSLAHTWIYLLGFEYPGIVHSLFYGALLLIVYQHLRRHCSETWSLLSLLLIGLSPGLFGHAHMTYTNLAYAAYLVTGYLYLFSWLEKKDTRTGLLAAILIGCSTWTRSTEPFWLPALGTMIVMSLYHRRWWLTILNPTIIGLFQYIWAVFERNKLGESTSLAANAPRFALLLLQWQSYVNLWEVSLYFISNVLRPAGTIYLMFGLGIVVFFMNQLYKEAKYTFPVVLILLNLGLTFVGVYLFSIYYTDWRSIGGSAQRMTMFFSQLIFYWLALIVNRVYGEYLAKLEKTK